MRVRVVLTFLLCLTENDYQLKGESAMTLDTAKRGQRLMITSITNPQVRAQAIRFGIAEGAEATCEQAIPAGPIVLSRNRQEIAIGRSLAKEIGVKFLA